MTFDTAEAARIFTKEFEHALAEPPPEAVQAAAMAMPGDFCGTWRKVKPILEQVARFIVLFPSFGPVAGAAIAALLKVGDAIYDDRCG